MIDNDAYDWLNIDNLRCSCHIGCKEEERQLPQVLFISVSMGIDTKHAALSDDLDLTVNYAKLNKELLKLCEQSTCKLIETLAANIAAYCLSDKYPLIQVVRIRIAKPAGIANADGASLTICRRRGEI